MELVLLQTRDRVEEGAGLLAGARPLDDLAIPRDDIVEAAQRRVERQAWRREWLARELLAHGVLMVAIDVGVREHVNEFVGDQAGELRHQVEQHGVLRHIEGHAEEEIAGPLVHHQAELSVPYEELKERVARGQAGLIQLAGIPRSDHVTSARRIAFQALDDGSQLIDVIAIWRDPLTPLLPVIASRIALESGLRHPIGRVGVAIPDADAERVELVHIGRAGDEPQQLTDHGAERKTLGRHGRKAVRHLEAHDLAEDRARPGARPVVAIDALLEGLAQDVEVLPHGPSVPPAGRPVLRRASSALFRPHR